MAVQQNRMTRAKRGTRRAHDGLKPKALSLEPTTGEAHLRHHMSPDGYYRGRRIITPATEDDE